MQQASAAGVEPEPTDVAEVQAPVEAHEAFVTLPVALTAADADEPELVPTEAPDDEPALDSAETVAPAVDDESDETSLMTSQMKESQHLIQQLKRQLMS